MSTLLTLLSEIDGIGEKKAKELITAGVKSVDDLKLPNYFALLSIEAKYAVKYHPNDNLSWDHAHNLVEFFRKHASSQLVGVGSYRRERAFMKDVDMISTITLNVLLDKIIKIVENPLLANSTFRFIGAYSTGTRRLSMIVFFRGSYIRVDFFYVKPEEKPYALLHYTGSYKFNIRVRAHAKKRGFKLNQYGLYDNNNKLIVLRTESQILKYLGITYKAPSARSD